MNAFALSTRKKGKEKGRKKIKEDSERGSKRGEKEISCWKKQAIFGLEFN